MFGFCDSVFLMVSFSLNTTCMVYTGGGILIERRLDHVGEEKNRLTHTSDNLNTLYFLYY